MGSDAHRPIILEPFLAGGFPGLHDLPGRERIEARSIGLQPLGPDQIADGRNRVLLILGG